MHMQYAVDTNKKSFSFIKQLKFSIMGFYWKVQKQGFQGIFILFQINTIVSICRFIIIVESAYIIHKAKNIWKYSILSQVPFFDSKNLSEQWKYNWAIKGPGVTRQGFQLIYQSKYYRKQSNNSLLSKFKDGLLKTYIFVDY